MPLKPITNVNIAQDRIEYPNSGLFFDGLADFLDAINNRLELFDIVAEIEGFPSGKLKDSKGAFCSNCWLEFFYYFEGNEEWQDGIWAKLHGNKNNINIWNLVKFSAQGRKRAKVFSECNLELVYTRPSNYTLPPNFINAGIFYTPRNIIQCSFEDVIDEMCIDLKCTCITNCKP